ncbi:MAG: c-type cytochrome [Bacteroidetes bacterium]|nr:c-type cytochrome [Bacteroidota bacterium]
MKKLLVLAVLVSFVCLVSFKRHGDPLMPYPKGWPKPVYDFKKNPLSIKKVELGRVLFYDPILSRDSTISCNGCHSQYMMFAHTDHALSHGIAGKLGTRNAPGLFNLAWGKSFMWDGSVASLDMQPRSPITNPVEMDENIPHVLAKLQSNQQYRALFYDAYSDSVIKEGMLLGALSQFMLIMVSANSKYDSVQRGESVFTAAEARGYAIYKAKCSACHTEPLFTNEKFENNGLAVDRELSDIGKMKASYAVDDSLKFKVPSLRNIQYTYPYMHDGRFKNLNQVLNNYIMGIQQSPTLNKRLRRGIYLSDAQKADLVAFLYTLSDKEFVKDPRFSFPKK